MFVCTFPVEKREKKTTFRKKQKNWAHFATTSVTEHQRIFQIPKIDLRVCVVSAFHIHFHLWKIDMLLTMCSKKKKEIQLPNFDFTQFTISQLLAV